MRKVILLLGLWVVAVVSLAQSYKYGEMIKWDTETRPYHGVTQKIVAYQIKNSMTTYTVTQGTAKPSELASRKLVEFRIDKNNRWVMYIKDKFDKEIKYSVISIGSSAR